MGASVTKLIACLVPAGDDTRILMLGLDNAGKTTTLWKLGEVVSTTLTIGFKVETVKYKGPKLTITVPEVEIHESLRARWHQYLADSKALIFVVDSANRDRVSEAKAELWNLMSSDALGHVPVLVFANKQDMPRAMEPAALAEALDLHRLPASRAWHVQPCTAVSGGGLFDGLEWLSSALKASHHAS